MYVVLFVVVLTIMTEKKNPILSVFFVRDGEKKKISSSALIKVIAN